MPEIVHIELVQRAPKLVLIKRHYKEDRHGTNREGVREGARGRLTSAFFTCMISIDSHSIKLVADTEPCQLRLDQNHIFVSLSSVGIDQRKWHRTLCLEKTNGQEIQTKILNSMDFRIFSIEMYVVKKIIKYLVWKNGQTMAETETK